MPKPSNTALDAAMPGTVEENLAYDPRANWEFVQIPDRDILDYPFGGIGINLKRYGPKDDRNPCGCASYPQCETTGSHKVAPDIAAEIRERIAIAQKQDMKLFSAKVNLKALGALYNERPGYASALAADAKVNF